MAKNVLTMEIKATDIPEIKELIETLMQTYPVLPKIVKEAISKLNYVWPVDASDKADAERFRWLLNDNGYFMYENALGVFNGESEESKNKARARIDREILQEKTT